MCISLEVHYRLEELRLRGNGIGSNGGHALAALVEVTNAVIIDLSWNNVSGKGALSLLTNIGPNYSLRECFLSHNGIDDHAAKSMFAELTTNSKLKILDVSYNHITEQSCAVLFRELGEFSNLRELKMDGNPIGRAGAQWLFRSKLAVMGGISVRECSMEVRRSNMDVSFLQPNGPYALDLSLEQDIVILQQLVAIDAQERDSLPDGKRGFFEQIVLNGTPSRMSSVELCRWVDSRKYPNSGTLTFNFVCGPFVPLMLDPCDAKSFNGILTQVMQLIRMDDSLTASIVVSACCSNFVFSEEQALALLDCFPSMTGWSSLSSEPGVEVCLVATLQAGWMSDGVFVGAQEILKRRC